MKGIGNKEIVYEEMKKAINQLIAHHSVIFMPSRLITWVSSEPFQLGTYIAYDLNKIFNVNKTPTINSDIYEKPLLIPADTFLFSKRFKDFDKYKSMKAQLNENY